MRSHFSVTSTVPPVGPSRAAATLQLIWDVDVDPSVIDEAIDEAALRAKLAYRRRIDGQP